MLAGRVARAGCAQEFAPGHGSSVFGCQWRSPSLSLQDEAVGLLLMHSSEQSPRGARRKENCGKSPKSSMNPCRGALYDEYALFSIMVLFNKMKYAACKAKKLFPAKLINPLSLNALLLAIRPARRTGSPTRRPAAISTAFRALTRRFSAPSRNRDGPATPDCSRPSPCPSESRGHSSSSTRRPGSYR